jgi:hypothetical protein
MTATTTVKLNAMRMQQQTNDLLQQVVKLDALFAPGEDETHNGMDIIEQRAQIIELDKAAQALVNRARYLANNRIDLFIEEAY